MGFPNYDMKGGYDAVPLKSSTGAVMSDPVEIVQAYLEAMEVRELDRAKSMLGDGFQMVFPGTREMSTLEQLIDWAGSRYRLVRKVYQGFDLVPGTISVVYCYGTLAGERPDGTAFSGIRFIDRFELQAGQITRQDVWNDFAETQAGA